MGCFCFVGSETLLCSEHEMGICALVPECMCFGWKIWSWDDLLWSTFALFFLVLFFFSLVGQFLLLFVSLLFCEIRFKVFFAFLSFWYLSNLDLGFWILFYSCHCFYFWLVWATKFYMVIFLLLLLNHFSYLDSCVIFVLLDLIYSFNSVFCNLLYGQIWFENSCWITLCELNDFYVVRSSVYTI